MDDLHRRGQAPLLVVVEVVEQLAHLAGRAAVQLGVGGPPPVGQADHLAAGVGPGALPDHQLGPLEPGQQPAQVAGVDVEVAAQGGDLAGADLRQLVEHAGLGQRVGGAQQVVAQHADDIGVEAVERPDGGDPVVWNGHLGLPAPPRKVDAVNNRWAGVTPTTVCPLRADKPTGPHGPPGGASPVPVA
nr:hypothetical protein GCM10020241_01860 [Streptoalloteichus tenebrarius]